MKITEDLITKVHRIVNKNIYRSYPALDMANHPEGSIKLWMVQYVLDAYKEVNNAKGRRNSTGK